MEDWGRKKEDRRRRERKLYVRGQGLPQRYGNLHEGDIYETLSQRMDRKCLVEPISG
jgi:hypothetical protein